MKEILIISGKGGTGKTVVTGAFCALAENKVIVDCDVDAADLHLLLHPDIQQTHQFKSGKRAVIDKKFCRECGRCVAACRFEAISTSYKIEEYSCEGCGLCALICPCSAIRMEESISGEWFVSETKYGPLVHAKLGVAEENSGKLVAQIRKVSKELAKEKKADYVIIDGPPGTGCPVIASLSGVDIALIVTEPTLSGLHDAQRVIDLAKHFKVGSRLVINKYDLNTDVSSQIESFCKGEGVPVLGKIHFDKSVVESVVMGRSVVEHKKSAAAEDIKKIWSALIS